MQGKKEQVRIKYLTNVQKNIEIVISCISEFLKDQLEKDQKSQYVNFTKFNVLSLITKLDGINWFGPEILDCAEKKLEKNVSSYDNLWLIYDLMAWHIDDIVHYMNRKQ